MTSVYYNFLLASTYGSNAYDGGNYNGTGTGTSGGTAAAGGLSNTGIAVAGIVTLAAVILLVAMVVRVWRRPSKQASASASSATTGKLSDK